MPISRLERTRAVIDDDETASINEAEATSIALVNDSDHRALAEYRRDENTFDPVCVIAQRGLK